MIGATIHPRNGGFRRLVGLLALGLLVGACESNPLGPTIGEVRVTAESTSIAVGETTEVTAVTLDEDGEPVAGFDRFRWSLSGAGELNSIASDRREFRGTEAGTATITATLIGHAGSVSIEVVVGAGG